MYGTAHRVTLSCFSRKTLWLGYKKSSSSEEPEKNLRKLGGTPLVYSTYQKRDEDGSRRYEAQLVRFVLAQPCAPRLAG